jgi:hypothetical protein
MNEFISNNAYTHKSILFLRLSIHVVFLRVLLALDLPQKLLSYLFAIDPNLLRRQQVA